MEFFGRIFGLTATLIAAAMFLLVVAIFAAAGLLDEAGRALIALMLLPVKLVDFLITLGQAVAAAFSSGGGGGGTPPTTT